MRTLRVNVIFILAAFALTLNSAHAEWWDAKLDASLNRAPEKRDAWLKVLRETKPEHREGIAYLIEYLPLVDLNNLPPASLAQNVSLAYQAQSEVAWAKKLPAPIFLDAVLPHASMTEPRNSSRQEFHDKYIALVKDCKTPGEAALKLNATLFKDYKVTYNTRRLRTDQNAKESIAQGMATCTGLSIMLVEASRSVGIPARVAGISSWPGRGGNHTWVEIWDAGEWHCVGAAEPDPKGLDHAWFVGEAAGAIKSTPRNAVWAITYRPTGEHFPLVWNSQARIPAENVSDRYKKGVANTPKAPRLMVEVRKGGQRIEAQVDAIDSQSGESKLSAKSLGPQADINLHLQIAAKPGESFLVFARDQGQTMCRLVTVQEDTVVRIDLDKPQSDETRAGLKQLLSYRFGTDARKREMAAKLLPDIPFDADTRSLAWEAYKSSQIHADLKKEFDSKTVKTANRTSPYLWRHVGEKPKKGWGLVIAMHGGGGAPKQVNDGQWNGMFTRYYKDHPEVGGYVYLALRAPNDEWNGFYDDQICPLIARLIRQFVLFDDVDPDRVVILGASHGGYGAFVIGPKMPDRFSAVHASASAPTPGETIGQNLRNVHFTFMVGSRDTAYGRADRCQAFAKEFEAWRKEYGGFPGGFEWKPGVGHSVPDRDKLAELLKLPPRNVWRDRLIWIQSDDVLKQFYYVQAEKPADKGRIDVSAKNNVITVKAEGQGAIKLWLDAPLVDLKRPVEIKREGGASKTITPKPSLETFAQSLELRGDPILAAPVLVDVP